MPLGNLWPGRVRKFYVFSHKAVYTLVSTTRMLRQSIIVFQRKKTLFPIEGSWNDFVCLVKD